MNLSFQTAMKTARELKWRVTRLTSQVALKGATYARHALRSARSAASPNATIVNPQAQNREKFAVEAISPSLGNSVYATAERPDTPSPPCNVSNFPVRTSFGRTRPELTKREEVTAEAVCLEPLRGLRAVPTGLSETAAAGADTSAFNFKSIKELSFDMAATLQHVKFNTDVVKTGATGTHKSLSGNSPNDLNSNNDGRIESAGDVELCILVLTETARALRDMVRDRPDLLPRELLDDLQQVNRKIVQRLSKSSFQEREGRRNQVLH